MPIKPSHILGMNARYYYTKLNPSSARSYGFSKLKTKKLLAEHNLPTAKIYHTVQNLQELDELQWNNLPIPFVVKPASGSAGKGIILITRKKKSEEVWYDEKGNALQKDDLLLHITNILDGEFSTWGSNHKAIIEEMIIGHPEITKYAYKGTPDLRIIVFNSVPVMAMVRIPTPESEGKANLDQGAIALGLDMATGLTTYGLYGKSKRIVRFPKSGKKIAGIKIPYWKESLLLAVKAAQAAGYMFMGADIFIQENTGPMIVELNGFPGLSIQLANQAGLKRRLERVEGIDVRNAEHGVKIAQALFAENFSDAEKAEDGLKIIPTNPKVTVYDDRRKKHQTSALVNTARLRSAISEQLAHRLGLFDPDDLLWQQESLEGKIPVIEASIILGEKRKKTAMLVSKKLNKGKYRIELGRKDTQGFLIGELE